MPFDLSDKLVIGISSRALFDLETEHSIFSNEGVEKYAEYQRQNEAVPLKPGTAFPLVQALLKLNALIPDRQLVEVVIISRNSPDTGVRAFNALEAHGLKITRAAFTGGSAAAPYLKAFEVDLFLSKNSSDVQEAVDSGVAAAQILLPPLSTTGPTNQIRIAFDGDAVLFSPESERVFKEKGLGAFLKHERRNKHKAMAEGPFAKLLLSLAEIQKLFPKESCPVRVAIVTARDGPAHARVIHTLREWNVTVDEAFFLGGIAKDKVLHAFGAHMFFDDQETHVAAASKVVPTGWVPYVGGTLFQATKRTRKQRNVEALS